MKMHKICNVNTHRRQLEHTGILRKFIYFTLFFSAKIAFKKLQKNIRKDIIIYNGDNKKNLKTNFCFIREK